MRIGCGWLAALSLAAACAPARPWRANLAPVEVLAGPTARVEVIFVLQTPTPLPPVTEPPPAAPAVCASALAVCWDAADQAKVAHICYEEARGLLTAGMVSCASTIARRQTEPDWYGGNLDEILVWEQFRVEAAVRRPWARGVPAPAEALTAVAAFLAGDRAGACWGYDSFRGHTPEAAAVFVAAAPERRCAVSVGSQAMIFFDWRNP